MLKIDVEPITPKLLNKQTAHSAYIKHTQEEATVLRDLVEHHSKLNANSELKCVKCNGCMLSDNHDLCVLDFINNVNARKKSKSVNKSSNRKVWKPTRNVFSNIGYIWRPIGRTFTVVENVCPLTRITTTTEVPLRKPTALENETPKPVVTLVYSRKPRKSKTNVPISKSKVPKFVSANKKEPSQSWGSKVSDVPSSSLDECRSSKLFSGFGVVRLGNVMISRVYYVEGLGHNLFSVGQFCDSNLEVAFRQHTCFIRNLEGVDLLTGSQGKNLYTLSLGDMMASSPICLLSKASKTKSWLWHREDNHDIKVAHYGVMIRTLGIPNSRKSHSVQFFIPDQDGFVDQVTPNHVYKHIRKLFIGVKPCSTLFDHVVSFLILSQDFAKGSGESYFVHPIFINQSKYALESLKKYGFDSCDPVDTLMVEKSKLDEDKEGKTVDPSHYRGMIGTLLYLIAKFADAEIIAGCQDIYAVAHSWVVCSFWEIGDRLVRSIIESNLPLYQGKHVRLGLIELYFVNREYSTGIHLPLKTLQRERIVFFSSSW
ncbi:hypothetical protein Tco_1311127 [Tanacetum coccineum]